MTQKRSRKFDHASSDADKVADELVGRSRVLDLLAEPAGVEDVELPLRRDRKPAGLSKTRSSGPAR